MYNIARPNHWHVWCSLIPILLHGIRATYDICFSLPTHPALATVHQLDAMPTNAPLTSSPTCPSEKPSGQYLSSICDDSLTCLGLNLNPGGFASFTFIFVSYGESCLLISWCAGDRCGMAGSNKDHSRSRRLGAEDQGWSSTMRGRTVERSGDIVCDLHRA
jgi:hypothetical protein